MAGWVCERRKTHRPRADGYDVANYWHDIAAAFFVGLRRDQAACQRTAVSANVCCEVADHMYVKVIFGTN